VPEFKSLRRLLISQLFVVFALFASQDPSINMSPPPQIYFSSLHTYLVGKRAFKKTLFGITRPALHIAESSNVQYPSGSCLAEFLIAPFNWLILFIERSASC